MNMLNRLYHYVLLLTGVFLLCVSLGAHADDMEEASKLFKQGHHDQALNKVNAYLINKPKDAQARFLKGLILTEQAKTSEAIKIFTSLTEDYPELPEPYNNLAVLYASQSQYDKAKQALEMAIRTHPSYATAHENLGDIYAKMASQAYDRALQLDSSNTATQTKLAMIHELFNNGSRENATPEHNSHAEEAGEKNAPVAAGANKPGSTLPESPPEISHENEEGKNVQDTVMAWAAAWSSKDVAKYLSFYADDFKIPSGETHAAWEASRRERLSTPKFIKVDIRSLTLQFIDNDHVSARFHQSYTASHLKAAGRKTLLLVKSGGKWLIQEERAR